MRLTRSFIHLSVILFFSHTSIMVLAADENRLSTKLGVDYSSGDYGSETRTEIWYTYATLKHERKKTVFKLTLPYLRIKGPSSVIGGGDAPIVIDPNSQAAITTESGIGDIVFAASYNLIPGYHAWPLLDFTAKAKLATADEDKGLGTGENDYFVELETAKSFNKNRLVVFSTVGYKYYGDIPATTMSAEVDFNNVYYGSLGSGYKLGKAVSSGLIFDYREAALETSEVQKELTAYLSWKINASRKLLFYAVGGLTDGSPDWGLGLTASFAF